MIGTETMRNLSDNAMRMTGEMMGAGRNLWLAGLGTVATVETEVKDVFTNLVEKGKAYDEQRPHVVGDTFENAKDGVMGAGKKVEETVQGMVAATLHRLGVPTRDEIHALIARVEALTAKVETLSKK